MKKAYEWYLEPLDSFTNDVIARRLITRNGDSEDDRALRMIDTESKVHSVWAVDHPFVAQIQKSKRSFSQPLRFNVFNRRGSYGPLRLWQLALKKKKSALKAPRRPLPVRR